MHLLLGLASIIAVLIRKDYQNWKVYFPTMQYIALGNLTYNFFCASHWLWRLTPDFKWYNLTILEIVYTFITFPLTALMFLSRYPNNKGKGRIFLHYLCWIGIYGGIEYILMSNGTILYKYGWGLGWSIVFDCVMFPFIWLHHKHPLLTMALSVPMAIFWILLFDVPVSIPIEDRTFP